MKKYLIGFVLFVGLSTGYSCKGKNDKKQTDATTNSNTSTTESTAPVVVSEDDELRKGVKDATKDFPDVNATVDNGIITLTGSIQKDRYLVLKQTLDALRPKQVINNLNYK